MYGVEMNLNLSFAKYNAWLVNNQDIFQEELSYTKKNVPPWQPSALPQYRDIVFNSIQLFIFCKILIDGFVLFLKVCYVQKYMTESAAILYDLGCAYEQVTRNLQKCVVRYNGGMLKRWFEFPKSPLTRPQG